MSTLAQLTKRRAKFEVFLTERGAQILQPTNEWEVLRFRSQTGVSIIYRNAQDGITFTGDSADAWNAFSKGQPWRGTPATKSPKNVDGKMRAIIKRDGENCFYCGHLTNEEDRTIEHLVSRTHGGPNHLSNMFLAHRKCNAKAGCLSAVEKIRLRDKGGLQ
ncbi:HNH endonuclease [Paraburkholderia silvatlantica]|uniref:HNH endonuclease n=1 Tax=Paraburkholderia silvatlantica TaxID=321895 RepID=A0A2V4T2P0_9BURK|nr:HNH endonuclease signature motif containing protein [Paraburkholderia silvatlantica]PYE13394.1 HNH endonuclease [Paraburkholderia silvatlantica]